MIQALEFDQAKHLFSCKGKRVPSVTQILKELGIIDGRWYTEESRERGEKVHRITALHDAGKLDPKSVDPALTGYYQGYLKFLDEKKPLVFGVELIVSDEIGCYAGITDRLMYIDEIDYAVDIKTGSFETWHRLQVHAYARCMGTTRGAILSLKSNGTYKFQRVQIHNVELTKDWNALLRVYHMRRAA